MKKQKVIVVGSPEFQVWRAERDDLPFFDARTERLEQVRDARIGLGVLLGHGCESVRPPVSQAAVERAGAGSPSSTRREPAPLFGQVER
jgi:hypothetical protein